MKSRNYYHSYRLELELFFFFSFFHSSIPCPTEGSPFSIVYILLSSLPHYYRKPHFEPRSPLHPFPDRSVAFFFTLSGSFYFVRFLFFSEVGDCTLLTYIAFYDNDGSFLFLFILFSVFSTC